MSARTSAGSLPANPTIYNVTLTVADTEYEAQLSQYTKRFTAYSRGGQEFRAAFETGRVAGPVAPYLTIRAGKTLWEDDLFLRVQTADWDGTLYLASSQAGTVIEVMEWV